MKKVELQKELLDHMRDGISLKEVIFWIGMYIQKDQGCLRYRTYEGLLKNEEQNNDDLNEVESEINQQKIEKDRDFGNIYTEEFKKWKQVLKAFEVTPYFAKRQTKGKVSVLTKAEAIFVCEIFFRMHCQAQIWKKIRNIKNEDYQGFIEIYHKIDNRRQLVEEIDYFIDRFVNLLLETSAKEDATAIQRHLVFITQRLKIDMLELIEDVNFIPDNKTKKINIQYYLEYSKYLERLHREGCQCINKINQDFIEKAVLPRHNHISQTYHLPIDTLKEYEQYIEDYNKQFFKKQSDTIDYTDDTLEVSNATPEIIEEDDYFHSKAVLLDLFGKDIAQETMNMYRILSDLLEQLQKHSKKYANIKRLNLKNSNTSNSYSNKKALPISFPSDVIYACAQMSLEDRKKIFAYYEDF